MTMVEPVGDDWLLYLVQPTRLLSDRETLSSTRKMTLLKQFLSQAEVTDRRSNAANSDNLILDALHPDFDPHFDPATSDTLQPYKKSKILDVMSLQLAADMKFNLNLFGITSAMPVKLLIRLCRAFVTNTARHSTALKHLFDLAPDKDSILLVDPYSTYAWISLHPTTVYAIMCYHIMCFQVSLAGSLLPRPFRSFTPAVSGLTEIPASTFFPDMPADIGGILTRILESVNQLLDIYNLLDNLNIARPLPTAFCPFESANPPILEPQSDGVPEPKDNDLSHLFNAKLLTKEYVSATINFIIGRYDFQQHQFDRARERFELVIELMNSKHMDYLEECGATLKLISVYVAACHSYDLAQKPCTPIKEFTEPRAFVQDFSQSLRDLINTSSEKHDQFWLDHCPINLESSMIKTSNSESSSPITIEDFLCKCLMDDICSLILKRSSTATNLPLGLGLRQWLEKLCFKYFVQSTTKYSSSTVGSRTHHSPHKPHRQAKANSENATSAIQASGKLFTKVHICNALERLKSNSFELPLQLVVEILTGQLNSSNYDGTQNELSGPLPWDFGFAREFLFNCLHQLLEVIESKTNELASVHYKRLVPQFIMFMVQEGISLVDESSMVVRANPENVGLLKEFHFFMDSLRSHKLVEHLPPDCVQLINATVSKYSPGRKPTNLNLELIGLPDSLCDIEKSTDKSQCGDVDLRTELYVPTETEMTNTEILMSSTGDVDIPSHPPIGHHQAPGFTGFKGPGPSGYSGLAAPLPPIFHLDSTSLVPNAHLVRRLLCTLEPGEIKHCVVQLLRTGMSFDAILGLNSAWIPTLRYFILLGGPRLHPPMEVNMQDPLECSISFTNNVPNLISILIQLTKASLITRHQTTALSHARTLLLTSLSALNPDLPSTNPNRPIQCALWIRAALRHELLLTDLLEFLDPSTTEGFLTNLSSRDHQRHKPTKKNQPLGFGTNSKVKLNSLSNRAKICIFHALGLPDNAKDLESMADSNNPVCLSNELLGASACFLLLIGEQPFLTSVFTLNKHGNISQRRSYFGSLELIRILLWLHEMFGSHSACLKRNDEPKSTAPPDSGPHGTDSKLIKNHGWVQQQQQIFSKLHEKTPYSDRLKTAAEELFNFLIYGCLSVETSQRKQAGSHMNAPNISDAFDHQRGPWSGPGSSCQLNIPELCTVIQYLASITESFDTRRPPTAQAHSEPKRKSPVVEQTHCQRSPNGLELLHYLLISLVHLLHTINPSVSLSSWKTLHAFSSVPCQSMISSVTNENRSMKPKLRRLDTSGFKQAEHNLHVDYSVLLSSDLWPSELNANIQVSSNVLCELIQFVLTCLLEVQPNRIDLLALRSELELFRKDYRSVLSTYLELGAIVSDSFTCDVPTTIYSSEIVSRMIQCCKSLGMIHEAIVLCQFNSDPDLIETGVQMIITQLENLAPVGPTSTNGTNGLNNTQQILAESFTGACGGLLAQSVFDCPDDLLNYLWEIRLIETLATSSARRGAMSQLTKFRGFLNTPELNSNNPEEVLTEHRIAIKLQFLRHLADLCLV